MTLDMFYEETARYVLENGYDELHKPYIVRLKLLYSAILEEAYDSNDQELIKVLINDIRDFESSQKVMSILYLSEFDNITPDLVLALFSAAAYGLALRFLMGSANPTLAKLMKEEYDVLISSEEGFIPNNVKEKNSMTISETLLDFILAGGNTDIMSLRIKKQWDSMN